MLAGGDWLPGGITYHGPLVTDGSGIDTGIFIRVMPCAGNRESAIIIIGDAHNTILLGVELV